MKKHVVVILGMHRSGTSTVARIFANLGYAFGENLLDAQPDNPDGFWENRRIVDLHDNLLLERGSNWFDPVLPVFDSESDRRACIDDLKLLLRSEFEGCDNVCIKDPRICKFFELWVEALQECDFDVKFLTIVRSPDEVVRSIGRRNGYDPEAVSLSWLVHNIGIIRSSNGVDGAIVMFDELLESSEQIMQDLLIELGIMIDQPALSNAVAHIDSAKVNSRFSNVDEGAAERGLFYELAGELYERVKTCHSRGPINIDDIDDKLSSSLEIASPWLSARRHVSDDRIDRIVKQLEYAYSTLIGEAFDGVQTVSQIPDDLVPQLLDSLVSGMSHKIMGIQGELEDKHVQYNALHDRFDELEQECRDYRGMCQKFKEGPLKEAITEYAKRLRSKVQR